MVVGARNEGIDRYVLKDLRPSIFGGNHFIHARVQDLLSMDGAFASDTCVNNEILKQSYRNHGTIVAEPQALLDCQAGKQNLGLDEH